MKIKVDTANIYVKLVSTLTCTLYLIININLYKYIVDITKKKFSKATGNKLTAITKEYTNNLLLRMPDEILNTIARLK